MTKQHVAVPLLESVHSSADALALRHPTSIGGIECDVFLPTGDAARSRVELHLKPPDAEHQGDPYWSPSTGWPGVDGWPDDVEWGRIDGIDTVTITTVGLSPVREPVPWNGGLLAFDHAVGQWRHVLRDWLSVISGGPTDFHDLPVKGETQWNDDGYTNEVWENYYENTQLPRAVSRWQWQHVLAHIHAGDEPPLARALLTTAKRAAAVGSPRLAVIDAATAAEVALTTGIANRLSIEASPKVVQTLLGRTRMLGPRIDLARDLGMTLPDRLGLDLMERRNTVMHRGTKVTDTEAQAAIKAAAKLVDEYAPLAAECQEPFPSSEL